MLKDLENFANGNRGGQVQLIEQLGIVAISKGELPESVTTLV